MYTVMVDGVPKLDQIHEGGIGWNIVFSIISPIIIFLLIILFAI